MTQPPTTSDFSRPADALAWLIDMGADEIILEHPVNRFAENAQAPKPKAPAPSAPPPKPTAAPLAAPSSAHACNSIADLAQALNFFEAHPLRKTATRLSFFEGPENAEVLIISDRPRNEEDKSGLVFAGKSRVLLANMLAAIGLTLEQVALMNLIPWRPPGNRAPQDSEIAAVLPFAQRALQLTQPKFILAFSALPGQHLAGGDASILRQRGKWQSAGDIPLLATLHPNELLKFQLQKKLAWRDLQMLRDKMK